MSEATTPAPRGGIYRVLDLVERLGNKLPDPAILFLLLMLAVWAISWLLSGVSFAALLLGFWAFDIPLGLGSSYRYPAP